MSRHSLFASFGVAGITLTMTACGPRSMTDLEILNAQPVDAGPASVGDTIAFQVTVRNNGRDPQTVAAAVPGDVSMGLIRKGPAVAIGRNRTETLSLDIPATRTYVRRCELVTNMFLARPGEPGNLGRDMWLDPVPENNNRAIRVPLSRPLPTDIQVAEPIHEVVDARTGTTLTRHYEATVTVLPPGSGWAITEWQMQTQTALGEPVEVFNATLTGDRLRTGRVIWTGAERRRDSVARALVRAEVHNCADEESELLEERVAIQLVPR
jgi:hypothetical protein